MMLPSLDYTHYNSFSTFITYIICTELYLYEESSISVSLT